MDRNLQTYILPVLPSTTSPAHGGGRSGKEGEQRSGSKGGSKHSLEWLMTLTFAP